MRREVIIAVLVILAPSLGCSCGARPGESGAGDTSDTTSTQTETSATPAPCPHEYFGEAEVQWSLDSESQALVAADLDGDGLPDLVVTRDRREIVVLRNRGRDPERSRTFDVPMPIERSNSRGVAVTDWNGDGLLDLVSVSGRIFVFENKGGLRFEKANDDVRREHSSDHVLVADMNDDGREDILVYGGRGMTVYPAPDGQGVLGEPFSVELGPLGLRRGDVGDLDGDGVPDLVIAAYVGDPFLIVAHGDGRGGLERIAYHRPPVEMQGLEARLVDVDADGLMDVVVVGPTMTEYGTGDYVNRQPRLVWMRGIGGGELAEGEVIELTPGSSGWTLAHADLDGSGTPELVTYASGLQSVEGVPGAYDLLAYRDGRLAVSASGFIEAGTAFGRLLVADMDGDGAPDLVRATGGLSVRWGCPR